MLTKELKDRLMKLLECCSDSDIEDFIDDNNLTSEEAREVWEIVAINNAPDCCKDCKMSSIMGMIILACIVLDLS